MIVRFMFNPADVLEQTEDYLILRVSDPDEVAYVTTHDGNGKSPDDFCLGDKLHTGYLIVTDTKGLIGFYPGS